MSDTTQSETVQRNDQALPSMATWTPPWEGNINRPRPVDRPERAHISEEK